MLHYIDFSLKPVIENGTVTMLIPEVKDITETVIAQEKLKQLTEKLEQRVAERTVELSKTNQKLTLAIQSFDSAMKQLAEAENLASLGAFVPGVTH